MSHTVLEGWRGAHSAPNSDVGSNRSHETTPLDDKAAY